MSDPTDFTKMVPGFDFLNSLVKNAGAAIPNVGQWIAPTLDPDELNKRIEELKTVQFWLEQNARLIGTTIQALEVQRMTLSTLKTMNVSLGDLTESLKIRVPSPPPSPSPASPAPSPAAAPRRPTPAPEPEAAANDAGGETAAGAPTAGAVDPMQWWGALTQQFTALAANALRENAATAIVQQGVEAAGQAFKAAAAVVPNVAAAQSDALAAAAAPRAKAAAKPAAVKKAAPRKAAKPAAGATGRGTKR